jgi:penicillin-binding protein 1A
MRRSLVVLALAAAPLVAAAAPWDLPSLDPVLNYRPKQHLTVLTSDGAEIAAFGEQRRQFVPIDKTPKLLVDAVLAVEDARFREHSGIDPKGMARAAIAMLTGGRRQGASTITQQVARTFFLSQRFTAERKTKEILIALEMEKQLSKDKILELYFNEIFLGQRAYGFAAAAQTYFGKPLDKLTLAETAMLAGLPQNPHYANPIANFERATKRQRIVLERMRVAGVITAEQQAKARDEKIALAKPRANTVPAGHVAEMARLAVVERFGADAYTLGLKVTTSLRAADQRAAWLALRRGVIAHDRRGGWRGVEDIEDLPKGDDGPELERAAALALRDHRDDDLLRLGIVLAASPKELRVQLASGERIVVNGESLRWAAAAFSPKARAPLTLPRGAVVRVMEQGKTWTIAQWPQAEAAFVALDPQTGRVRALVGSFDFGRTPFNHATQALRQPGSSFKPLLYSAALERGVMPGTVIDDAPLTIQTGSNTWSPQNSDGQFLGPLALRDALAKSRNLVSVRVLQQVGVGTARDWVATHFGLDPLRQPDNLTLALGTGSVTPMQMAQAYAVLANGGWRVGPVVIERIVDAQGKVVFEAPPPAPQTDATRVLPERNAYLVTQMLGEVTRSGTAARAQAALQRPDLYGKTGTTNDAVDAWFAGFQPSLVAVAWMGYSEPKSLGERESGGGLALPIWIEYMATALKGVPIALPVVPPGLAHTDHGDVYAEWADGGEIERIGADGVVLRAAPPSVAPPSAAPPPTDPAPSFSQ